MIMGNSEAAAVLVIDEYNFPSQTDHHVAMQWGSEHLRGQNELQRYFRVLLNSTWMPV